MARIPDTCRPRPGKSCCALPERRDSWSREKHCSTRYGVPITHKITVKQEEAIILKLHPQQNPPSGTNYDDLEIKLIGEKFKDKWLNKTLKASDGSSKKIICVMMQKEGEYKYIVKVPGVGEIDPRVKVIRR